MRVAMEASAWRNEDNKQAQTERGVEERGKLGAVFCLIKVTPVFVIAGTPPVQCLTCTHAAVCMSR